MWTVRRRRQDRVCAAAKGSVWSVEESARPLLPRGTPSQLPKQVVTAALPLDETSSRLEHLGEALAIVRMDREDLEAHVMASAGSSSTQATSVVQATLVPSGRKTSISRREPTFVFSSV